MNILIRADSSSEMGTGHIMRDLVLAKREFKKDNVMFATRDLKGNINNKIKESGYKIFNLKTNNYEELNKLIKHLNIDMIVIDHYEIDYKVEKKLKEDNPGLKIMVLDDMYKRHYCDILLNHNIYAEESKYKDLVPDNCKLFCGKKYTLIREEFIKTKNEKKILLCIGGADAHGLNFKILKLLENIPDIYVDVLTTTANKNLEKLKKYTNNKNWLTLHINSDKVARLMKNSDLTIVTPSVVLNEVIYMEVPFIAIQTSLNQKYMVEYLKKNHYPVLEKFDEKEFLQKLKIFL
jgi:UDP-2,4-diacetamido-2,4,6-trideoxy-beta-L-altropyranose hydrolase